MKRLTLILFLFSGIVVLTTLSSCSNDDDEKLSNKEFIGSWKLIEEGFSDAEMKPVEDGEIMKLWEDGGLTYDWMAYANMHGYYTFKIKSDGFYKYINADGKRTLSEKYDYEMSQEYLKLTLIYSNAFGGYGVLTPNVFLYKRIE